MTITTENIISNPSDSETWKDHASVQTIRCLIDACFHARKLTESLPPLPDGLGVTHNRVLDIISSRQSSSQGCRVSDVARALQTSLPPITRIVTELEKKGYVCKKPDPSDRRAVRLALSEKGRIYHQKYIENFHCSWAENLKGIDQQDAERFCQILSAFAAAMPSSLEDEAREAA